MKKHHGKFFDASGGHHDSDSKKITTAGEGTSLTFGDNEQVQITSDIPEDRSPLFQLC